MAAETERMDLQDFLEQFRRSLRSPDPTTEPALPSSLAAFGQYCHDANHRLRECSVLTQRGQYANAVALSEREPNLFDRCVLLEIPERDQLATVARLVGAQPPTLLNRDLVASLQDAYQKGSNVTANLRHLHRLTLARAPLPSRLAIMRRLLIQDPNHPYMDEDIRKFERAWFKQASTFVQPYVKQGRPEILREVLQDFQEGSYLETPPAQLISNLQGHLLRAQAAQLPDVAAGIRRAHAEQSVWTLAQLAERWMALTAAVGDPGPDVSYRVPEALEWLRQAADQERAGQEKVEARSLLIQLLETRDAQRMDVEIAYQAARSLGVADDDIEQRFQAKLGGMNRRKRTIQAGAAAAAVLVVVSAIVGVVALMGPRRIAKADGEAEAQRPPAAESDRLAGTPEKPPAEPERQAAPPEKTAPAPPPVAARGGPRDEFEDALGGLKDAARKLLAEARRGRGPAGRASGIADLRRRLVALREQARRSGFGPAELDGVETTLAAAEAWGTLATNLNAFAREMEGASGTGESLERLARFLNDQIATTAPDPVIARRARLAQSALPTWVKGLETQRILQSGDFLNRPINGDDWKDQPPSGALAAAGEYAEMLRHRNPSVKGTEASRLRERLGRMDVVNLWVIRRTGESERYYTKEHPPAGDAKIAVNVLLNSLGREEQIPFAGKRQVARAPQSLFAEQAARLWDADDQSGWYDALADAHGALIESRDMDPLLKLDLVRRFQNLAALGSVGYRDILQEQPGFKALTGRSGLITGNWLDPGEDLDAPREQASRLLANAPRLRDVAAEAAIRDEQRLTALKQALIVSGWIFRDVEARPVLARFAGAKPAAGSRLYTVANGEWVNLGSVSADGKEIRVNEVAEQYVGWPVFALLLMR